MKWRLMGAPKEIVHAFLSWVKEYETVDIGRNEREYRLKKTQRLIGKVRINLNDLEESWQVSEEFFSVYLDTRIFISVGIRYYQNTPE